MTDRREDDKAGTEDRAQQTVLIHATDIKHRAAQEPTPEAVHSLVVVEGPDTGSRLVIDHIPRIVGRSHAVDFVLQDHSVSSRHCRVWADRDRLMVEDLQSSNGTFLGADRVTRSAIPVSATVRLGTTVLKHEFRSQAEVRDHEDLDLEIQKAAGYVRSLLPEPWDGRGISARWLFRPSARLGGDGFSYDWIDDQHLAILLIDVCGHGAGSALHAVSVLLRSGRTPRGRVCRVAVR